ncbi:MAG: hypothetical protein FJ279_04530 [Planctomycetes bacterium]|nr:hypothetical protein [Planctomycetota bacterium]
MRQRLGYAFALLVGLQQVSTAETVLVTLRVTDYAGVARTAEPVTSGVPLPEAAGIANPRPLRLSDEQGRELPAQFRVLSRWGELSDATKPIRWVLVDFQADAPANGSMDYRLVAAEQPSAAAKGIQIQDDARAITVAAGVVTFRVSKERFNLFDEVTAGGRTIVPSAVTKGFVVTNSDGKVYSTASIKPAECRVEEAGPLRCVILVRGHFADEAGNKWMGGNTELEMRRDEKNLAAKLDALQKQWPRRSRESWGDARWGGLWDGVFPDKQIRPLSYTARLTAYKDKSYVRAEFTLENNGYKLPYLADKSCVGLNDVEFKSLYAQLGLDLKGAKSAAVEGAVVDKYERGQVALVQYHAATEPKDESQNFTYQVTHDGKTLAQGKRADGWADLSDGQGGVTVAFDYFWQVFPKSLEIVDGELRAGLWPALDKPDEWGLSTHIFAHGWHKTHSLLFDFHAAGAPMKAAGTAAQFRHPLFAVATPVAWYADSGAWGMVTPAGGVKVADAELQEAVNRYEQERRGMIDPGASVNGQDLEWMREHGGGNDERRSGGHFGWPYYGIFLKYAGTGGCSVGHYDWPYIAWLHFIRTGERRCFEEGLRMTRHSIDLDQWHLENDGRDGLWMWEGAGTNYPARRPFHVSHNTGAASAWTHTWSGGYALGYLLTGDPRYFEALARTLNGSRRFWWEYMKLKDGKPVPYDQTRSQGWCILHHLNMYRITGERTWIEDAYKLFALSLLPSEHERSGAWPTRVSAEQAKTLGTDRAIVQTFHIYPIEPCIELHYWAAKAGLDVSDLTAFLRRWCDYTATKYYAPSEKTADGKYLPWRNEYMIPPDAQADPRKAAYSGFNVFTCSAFAYVGWLLREKDPAASERYTRIGREMFRDRYLYGRACWKQYNGPPEPLDPNFRYPINWLTWWPTHEKEQGWDMRASQPFLWTLYRESR